MIKVFYNDKQTARGNESFSPSAGKPELVVKSWKKLRREKSVKFSITSNFKPLTMKQIGIAHDEQYVKGILNRTKSNGFGNTSRSVADSLRWTTSSLYHASLYAVQTGNTAVSPTSGFHHASFSSAGGFCTFNGLMIAAMLLKKQGIINKIGIADLDAHYGNGTDGIIKHFGIDYIKHYTFGGHVNRSTNIDHWLKKDLPAALEEMKDCDLIIFQAGADPHISDPLGGFMTSSEMKSRDQIVFKFAKKNRISVVWALAGGYQTPIRKVLDLHDTTMVECSRVYNEK